METGQMTGNKKRLANPIEGQEYEKYTLDIHRCQCCKHRIRKNLLDLSKCPVCKDPLVVEVISRTVFKRKWRMLRPNWHLGFDSPDYDYKEKYWDPPRVNLICLRCKAIFQGAVLKEDLQIWKETQRNKGCEENTFSKLYSHDACPDRGVVIYSSERQLVVEKCPSCEGTRDTWESGVGRIMCRKCGGTGKIGVIKKWVPIKSEPIRSSHDFHILPRLVTVRPATTGNKQTVIYDISPYLSVGISTGETSNIIHEGGSGLTVDERGVTVRTTGTCFLPPPGFEPNPVEEMDDDTADELFAGLAEKARQKWMNKKVK